jgi:hypothetical protein
MVRPNFPDKGDAHFDSIDDEEGFVKWLNKGAWRLFVGGRADFSHAEARGGTQTVVDSAIVMKNSDEFTFSNKLAKEGVKKSSFTFLNTSKHITRLKKEHHPAVAPIMEFEEFRDSEVRTKSIKERKQYYDREKVSGPYNDMMTKSCVQSAINIASTDLIREFISEVVEHHKGADFTVHTDRKSRTRYWYRSIHHPLSVLLDQGYQIVPEISSEHSQKGFMLIFKKDEREVDPRLRLRLHYNNGVSVFFKMGNQKSGSFVLKLQQDPGSLPGMLSFIEEMGNLNQAPF